MNIKKKKKNKIHYLLISLLISGCVFNHKPCNDIFTSTSYYPNGSLMIEELMIGDSLCHGDRHEFYQNGQIKIITPYRYGLKNGLEEEFTEDGILISQMNFLEGLADGTARWYYPDGSLLNISNFYYNQPYGEQITFNTLGNPSEYYLCDLNESPSYKIIYNKYGKFQSDSGNAIASIKRSKLDNSNKLEFNILVATPPDFIEELIFKIYNQKDSLIFQKTLPVYGNKASVYYDGSLEPKSINVELELRSDDRTLNYTLEQGW